MKPIYKTICAYAATAAAVCAGFVGISGAELPYGFQRDNVGKEIKASILDRYSLMHRSSPGTKRQIPELRERATTESTQRFLSVLTYSDAWESTGDEPGVYTFDTTLPIKFSKTFISADYSPTGGAFFTDKYYILTTVSEDWFTGEIDIYSYKYSLADWEELDYVAQSVYALYNAICYDPIDDLAYGFFYSDDGGDWGYMNLANMSVSHIAPLDVQLVAVAIDEKGSAFGIGVDGMLYLIEKHTGKMTKVGVTGVHPQYIQSAAFGKDGKLYWAASEAYGAGLYTVDISTGKATEVGPFGMTEEVCAMYALDPEVSPEAPAPAMALAAHVSGSALSFPFSFRVPMKNEGGGNLTGDIAYEVMIDGVSASAGEATPGETVSVTLSVENPGYHLFKVILSNDAGWSDPASIRRWIGVDVPMPVTNTVVEKCSDTSIRISWTAPTAGVNGGFFDSSLISYNVTRLPENVIVAQNMEATEFTDEVKIESGQELIRYLITPYAENLAGRAMETPGIVLGKPYDTPVDFTFDTVEDYNIFTVIDNNETVTLDSGLWQYTPSGQAAGYLGGTKDGDDWLITPSVYLKGRTQYIFSHDVLCYSDNWPEEYSVYMGSTPNISGMTTELVPPSTIWWDEYRTRNVTVTVPEDGVYYFGFHATSEAGGVFFLVDNISVREACSLDAPSEVSGLNVEAGERGARQTTVSFTVPTVNVDGKKLENNVTVKICRDEVEIKSYADVAPGTELSYTDEDPTDRKMNSYQVFCANGFGDGPSVGAEVWVGLDSPSAPENARVILDEEGHPLISWSSPEGRGVHGGYVDNSDLSYTVAYVKNGALIPVAENISALSFTDATTTLSNTGTQMMHQYYVVPKSNATGEYGNNATALYISGKPYPLPFKESFKGTAPSNFWAFTGTGGNGWTIGNDFSIGSQDDDNGTLAYIPAAPEVVATAMSGKINLGDAKNPYITFYLRKMGIADNGFYDTDPSKDVLNIKVGVDSFTPVTIESIRLADIKNQGDYLFYSVPLMGLEAKDFIVVAFEYDAVSDRTPIMIDNITVLDMCDYNVMVGQVSYPETVEVFEDMEVEVVVTNTGNNQISNIVASLLHDDAVLDKTSVAVIDPNQSTSVSLSARALPEWGEEAEFVIEVSADNDELAGDNVSELFKVKVLFHARPAVNDLKGEVEADVLTLSWSEPAELSQLETRVTEGFDSYEHGDLSFGNWRSEDKSFWGYEGVKTITVDGVKLEIPYSDGAQAFMVFDPAMAGIDLDDNPEWEPVSGNKLLVSFGDAANDDMNPNNDWLVSPELSGDAQIISFWARTAAKKGKPDEIQVMMTSDIEYNVSGTVKPASFSAVKDGDFVLTRRWEKYEVSLPAGTKYFAIRNVSDDGFAVLIDDITYEPYLPKANALLEGYNVYRDETLLNLCPISDTTFTVSPVVNGTYSVRAVYDEGESEASNKVEIGDSGVQGVKTDNASGAVYDIRGCKVNNLESGRIYITKNKKFVKK